MTLLGCIMLPQPAQALTDEEVGEAIDKIKAYLYEAQHESGAWFGAYHSDANDSGRDQWGPTSMAALALVVSGESPQRPELNKAIELLTLAEMRGTYALSMRTHLWSYLPADLYGGLLSQDGQTMLRTYNGDSRFNYNIYGSEGFDNEGHRVDNSTTQYGLLAMWQVSKRGGRVPQDFWEGALKNFLDLQTRDGGWGYSGPSNATQPMTCAGMACMYIAQQELFRNQKNANQLTAEAIAKGLAYLDANYDLPEMNTIGGGSYTYYGFERVGLASGRRYFGGHDWFEEIATAIVAKNGRYGNSIHNAAFDLMFLARGRVPVWINKLEVPGVNWNNRPNDVYFLNRFISEFVEHEVNWQVVGVDTNPADWMNAPLLYLSAGGDVEFTDQQVDNIKQYLDMGGTLLVNPEERSSSFRASIEKLAGQMYPHLSFEDLSAEHPIASLLMGGQRAGSRPPIEVLNNGARDLIIMPSKDWGYAFQSDETPDPEKETHWQYIVNIYAVATDRGELLPRLSSPIVERTGRASTRTIKVVVPTIGGHGPPESDAYRFMKAYAHNEAGANLLIEQTPLADLVASDPTLVHLSGTAAVELLPTELDALNTYIEEGGTVLIENVGGRGDFAASVTRQMASILPGQDSQVRTGSLVTGRGLPDGAKRNRRIIYRAMTQQAGNPGTSLLLRGYEREDRFPVLVSIEDISLGMLGVRQYGINGYSVESARNIMLNILLEAEEAHAGSDTLSAPTEVEGDTAE